MEENFEEMGEVVKEKEKVPTIKFDVSRDTLLEFLNIASIKGTIGELFVNVTKNGLCAMNTDVGSVMMSVAVLTTDYFFTTELAERQLCIEADEVIKLLSQVREDELEVKITKDKMTMKTQSMKIKAPLLSYRESKDYSKLVKVSENLEIEIQYDYDFEYELKVAELRKALVMKGVDVVFKCHDNNISVTQYSSEYEVTTMFDFEEEDEGHKVILSYEYLQKVLSVCDKDGIVTCKFSKEVQPVEIDYNGLNGTNAVFLIAPRIDEY